MRTLIFILTLASLSSCITQEKCYERYPPQVRDSTVIKDTIIYWVDTFRLPGETVIIEDTIPCPQLEYHKSVTKNHVTLKIDISKGKVTFMCAADSLQRLLNRERKERVITRTKNFVSKPLIERKAYWYDTYFFRPVAGLSIILLLLYLLISRVLKAKNGLFR